MTVDLSWLTPRIQAIQDRHRRRLGELYAGKLLDPVMVIGGIPWGRRNPGDAHQRMCMLDDPRAWLEEVQADMARRSEAAANEHVFCPLFIYLGSMGVHFIDALLGARVYEHDGQIWNDPLDIPLGRLEMPDLGRSPVMAAQERFARLAVEYSSGVIPIANPTTSCAVNIGINVFGERLLEALLTEPESARHDLRVINDVIKEVVVRMQRIIPERLQVMVTAHDRFAPPGYGYVDGCATQLISPKQYDEFFAGLDAEVLALHRHGGQIHLCGASAQHIPAWRAMKPLASVQINNRAADDYELYFKGLRDDQIIYVAPTDAMPIERILAVSGGRRLVVEAHPSNPIALPK